jgi:GGDEF domain-containing protein
MSAATKPTTIDLQRARSQRSDVAASTMQAIFETQLALRRCRAFEELAGLDPLTQLGNRRYLYERLPAMIERGLHDGTPLTVAMVDLDHFKQVNDNHSHDVGDAVLQAVAGSCGSFSRTTASRCSLAARSSLLSCQPCDRRPA